MQKTTTTHRIKITAADRGYYQTTGAVAVTASNPMFAAATALIAAGRDPGDKLKGVYEGAWLSAVSLASIVRPRKHPKLDYKTPTYAH